MTKNTDQLTIFELLDALKAACNDTIAERKHANKTIDSSLRRKPKIRYSNSRWQKQYDKGSRDLNWCVLNCMLDGTWWTFWELQSTIKQNTGKFYGEPTISAAIRNLRKYDCRLRFGLPLDMSVELVQKKRITGGKGYKYRLINFLNSEDGGRSRLSEGTNYE